MLQATQKTASILAKLSAVTTFVNAIVSVILVALIYNAIIPVLKKSGFLLLEEKNES